MNKNIITCLTFLIFGQSVVARALNNATSDINKTSKFIHDIVVLVGEQEKHKLIQELFVKSGLAQHIPSYQEQISVYLNAYKAQLPPQVFSILEKEIRFIFEPNKLRNRVLFDLELNLDIKTIRHALVWLNSPLGKKITQLEEQASTKRTVEEIVAYMQKLGSNPPSANRVKIIKKLDTLTHATNTATDVGIYIGLSIIIALNKMNSNSPPFDEAKLRQYIEGQRSQIRPSVEQEIQASFLYTYQTLTDEELLDYIKFAESEGGKVYHEVILQSLLDALFVKEQGI